MYATGLEQASPRFRSCPGLTNGLGKTVSELTMAHVECSQQQLGSIPSLSSDARRAAYLARLGIQPCHAGPMAVNLRCPTLLKQQAGSSKLALMNVGSSVADKDSELLESALLPKTPSMSSLSTLANSSPPVSRSSSFNTADTEGSQVQEALQMDKRSQQMRTKYLQKLARAGVWVSKPRRPPTHQTIIIFDWDDTLLCSTFLKHVQAHGLTPDVQSILKDMEKSVTKLLELALSLGHTLIVTNAADGWVQQSAFRYLPGILPVLERVNVVSARSLCESRYPHEVSKWKTATFLALQRKLDPYAVTNVVALGDSPLEMEAASAMTEKFEQAVIKTIRFRESPSPKELARQQDLLYRQFEDIVLKGHDVRMSMKPRSRLSQGS